MDGPEGAAVFPQGLSRLLAPRPERAVQERCELCGEVVASAHPHVVDLEHRSLLCACRACHLLFTGSGAAAGRFRAVPDRRLVDPGFALSEAAWEQLQIPVGMAFFLQNSRLGRVVAFYPSPAGATESELDVAAWQALVAAGRLGGCVAPDVEALLVRRVGAGFECYLVPVDVCYELVGLMRLWWRGFDGGAEARRVIEAFFTDLQARATPADPRT